MVEKVFTLGWSTLAHWRYSHFRPLSNWINPSMMAGALPDDPVQGTEKPIAAKRQTLGANKRESNSDTCSVTTHKPTNSKKPASKRPADHALDAPLPYESPLKRVQRAVEREGRKETVETVFELKRFIESHGVGDKPVPAAQASAIAVRMRVAWTDFDTCPSGPVARMYLIDKQANDSVEEIHTGLRDRRMLAKRAVDTEVVSVSMYGLDANSPGVPKDGSIVLIRSVWTLKMFCLYACQFTTALSALTVES